MDYVYWLSHNQFMDAAQKKINLWTENYVLLHVIICGLILSWQEG